MTAALGSQENNDTPFVYEWDFFFFFLRQEFFYAQIHSLSKEGIKKKW